MPPALRSTVLADLSFIVAPDLSEYDLAKDAGGRAQALQALADDFALVDDEEKLVFGGTWKDLSVEVKDGDLDDAALSALLTTRLQEYVELRKQTRGEELVLSILSFTQVSDIYYYKDSDQSWCNRSWEVCPKGPTAPDREPWVLSAPLTTSAGVEITVTAKVMLSLRHQAIPS